MAGEIQLGGVTLATESGGVASIDSSVDIKGPLNASGSAPIYVCRAWVNFNGTGTVAIRASGNVSSITDNGSSGNYTVNLTTAMPDANYSAFINAVSTLSGRTASASPYYSGTYSTSAVQIFVKDSADITIDSSIVNVSVFR